MRLRFGLRERTAAGVLLAGAGFLLWRARESGALTEAATAILAAIWICAFSFVAGGPMLAKAILRVAVALAPLMAISGLVIWLAILPLAGLGDARPALVAGVVLATGWVATFLAAEFQKERDRSRTRDDTLLALRSEVVSILDKLDRHPIRKSAAKVQEKIEAGGDGVSADFPFAASESPTTVFEAVKGAIGLLRPETLEPALRFYAAFSELDALVKDSRSAGVAAMSAERRSGFHKELTQQRLNTLFWALRALSAINRALGVPDPEHAARSGKNPDIAL